MPPNLMTNLLNFVHSGQKLCATAFTINIFPQKSIVKINEYFFDTYVIMYVFVMFVQKMPSTLLRYGLILKLTTGIQSFCNKREQ